MPPLRVAKHNLLVGDVARKVQGAPSAPAHITFSEVEGFPIVAWGIYEVIFSDWRCDQLNAATRREVEGGEVVIKFAQHPSVL